MSSLETPGLRQLFLFDFFPPTFIKHFILILNIIADPYSRNFLHFDKARHHLMCTRLAKFKMDSWKTRQWGMLGRTKSENLHHKFFSPSKHHNYLVTKFRKLKFEIDPGKVISLISFQRYNEFTTTTTSRYEPATKQFRKSPIRCLHTKIP